MKAWGLGGRRLKGLEACGPGGLKAWGPGGLEAWIWRLGGLEAGLGLEEWRLGGLEAWIGGLEA